MKKLILTLLRIYKKTLSPFLVLIFGNSCRYSPTCSKYSYQAIEKHGIVKGLVMTIKRIARCHPFAKGGHDPVKV